MDCTKCPIFVECSKNFTNNRTPECCREVVAVRKLHDEDERLFMENASVAARWTVIGIIILLFVIVSCMVGCPSYNVYAQKMQGRAILAHAQSSREVAVAEAKAKMESACLLAAADTLRAQGVARSNIIIGQSLTESYLRWFWISELKPGGQVIYVPTEANLPILEAAKRKGN